MSWWLRVQLVVPYLLLLAATLLVGVFARASAMPLPSVVAGWTVPVPVPLLLPVVPVVCWVHGMQRMATAAVAAPVRSPARLDLCVLWGSAAVVATVALATVDVDHATLGSARNVAGYIGIALIARGLFGARPAAVAVVCFPVLCTAVGVGPGGLPHWWAWPIAEPTDPVAAFLAGCTLLAGTALSLRPSPVLDTVRGGAA